MLPFRKKLKIKFADIVYKKKSYKLKAIHGFRILAYHSITDRLISSEWDEKTTPVELFDRQMQYLFNNQYEVITCKQGLEYIAGLRKIRPKTVILTFDDGYKDNYLNALQVLKKYNFPATIFLTLNYLRDFSGDERFLSCSEITDIKKTGIIDFGCHGFTHKALSTLDEQQLQGQIKEAKQRLEGIISDRVDLFAYPYGHIRSFNKNIVSIVKSMGFRGAFTSLFGLNDLKTNPYLLRRNRISWIDGLDEFRKHLIGAYDWYALYQWLGPKKYRIS